VTELVDEAVTGIAAEEECVRQRMIPAIGYVVEHHRLALGHVHGLDDRERSLVLDLAVRVSRCEPNVRNDRASAIGRIDFSNCYSLDLLVRAHRAELLAVEHRRCGLGDGDLGNPRLRAAGDDAERASDGDKGNAFA
jgi:hypothetical protein